VKSNLLKGALESKLGELLGALSERHELRIEYLADRLDRVTSSRDRQITVRLLDTITGLIHDIRYAHPRIEEGSYGFCEQCGSAIQPKRLDVVPWARLCISCQSQTEAGTREHKVVVKRAAYAQPLKI
jgi:DnaK suppressor protein